MPDTPTPSIKDALAELVERHRNNTLYGDHGAWDRARAALAALAQQQEWRPIETAPKDGNVCVLVCTAGRLGSTGEAYWNAGRGRWICMDGANGGLTYVLEPTHWRHLPPPPTQGASHG